MSTENNTCASRVFVQHTGWIECTRAKGHTGFHTASDLKKTSWNSAPKNDQNSTPGGSQPTTTVTKRCPCIMIQSAIYFHCAENTGNHPDMHDVIASDVTNKNVRAKWILE